MIHLVTALGIIVSLLHCPIALGKTELEKVAIEHCKWMTKCAFEGLPPNIPKPPMEESFAKCETESVRQPVENAPELQALYTKCLKSQMATGCSTAMNLQSTPACKEFEATLKKKVDKAFKGQ